MLSAKFKELADSTGLSGAIPASCFVCVWCLALLTESCRVLLRSLDRCAVRAAKHWHWHWHGWRRWWDGILTEWHNRLRSGILVLSRSCWRYRVLAVKGKGYLGIPSPSTMMCWNRASWSTCSKTGTQGTGTVPPRKAPPLPLPNHTTPPTVFPSSPHHFWF